MKISSDFKDLLSTLNKNKTEYLLVGGWAVIVHSEPRYTKGIDIWVKPNQGNSKKVYDALTEFGAPLKSMDISPEDFEKASCGMFKISNTERKSKGNRREGGGLDGKRCSDPLILSSKKLEVLKNNF